MSTVRTRLGALTSLAAASAAVVPDYYTNAPPGVPLTAILGLSFTGSIGVIGHDSWVSSVSVLLGPSPPLYTRLALSVDGVEVASSVVPEDGVSAPPFGTAWVAIAMPHAIPLAAGVNVTINVASSTRRFAAGVVGDSALAVALNATRQPCLLVLGDDDGAGRTATGNDFASPPLDASALPHGGATVLGYAVLTDIYPSALRTSLRQGGADVLYSWLNTGDSGPAGVRWRTIGATSAAPIVLAPAGGAITVQHTSLEASRRYASAVRATGPASATGGAIGSVTLRPARPLAAFTSDDGSGAVEITGTSFTSPTVSVGAAAGFLRAVAVQFNPPVPPALTGGCVATVTVKSGSGRVTTSATLSVFNTGTYAPGVWRSLLLPVPAAVYQAGTVTVAHTCGGVAYTTVTRADGGALVQFELETFDAAAAGGVVPAPAAAA